jgi:hypothetical protein
LDNHQSTYLTKLRKKRAGGGLLPMDNCHFGYIKKIPQKQKNTASSEHKEMGMEKAKIFHFVTY